MNAQGYVLSNYIGQNPIIKLVEGTNQFFNTINDIVISSGKNQNYITQSM